jgi:hypothetical protein
MKQDIDMAKAAKAAKAAEQRDKGESFIRLVEARIEKIQHDFSLIRNLANAYNYEFDTNQLVDIYKRLEKEMALVHRDFSYATVFKYVRNPAAKHTKMDKDFMKDMQSFAEALNESKQDPMSTAAITVDTTNITETAQAIVADMMIKIGEVTEQESEPTIVTETVEPVVEETVVEKEPEPSEPERKIENYSDDEVPSFLLKSRRTA